MKDYQEKNYTVLTNCNIGVIPEPPQIINKLSQHPFGLFGFKRMQSEIDND